MSDDQPGDLESFRTRFSTPLDREISYAVKVLHDGGVETYESCSGGPGHSFPEPTIRFFGGPDAGLLAAAIALRHGLPIFNLRRFWRIQNAEIVGPDWEMTFFPVEKLVALQAWAEREKDPAPAVGGRG